MPFLYEVLQVLVNPNVSFVLLIAGLVGLGIELFSPGLIVPGAFGLISFLMGLYGSSQLPVNIAGVGLLVLGVGLLIAEAHLPSAGLLGVAGVISLVFAGLLLYDDGGSNGFGVSIWVVLLVAILLGGGMSFVVSKAVAARKAPIASGYEEIVGGEGVVRVTLDPVGQIFIRGALWRARAAEGEVVPIGGLVRVGGVEGLTLDVEPLGSQRVGPAPDPQNSSA